MSKPYRRFELLLPTNFNDGTAVPDNLIGQSIRDVRQRFGAVALESQNIAGYWE
jgi:hypothetical protein